MSDSTIFPPRPVPLVTILAILGCFSIFLLVVFYGYARDPLPSPHSVAPEKLAEDQAWRATSATKAAVLAELRANEQKKATAYSWIDQKAGSVQIPITRAMELIVQENAARR